MKRPFLLAAGLLCGAALVGGCDWTPQNIQSGWLNYSRDPRTGPCFASMWQSKGAVTNVPCTPEVLKLIGGAD